MKSLFQYAKIMMKIDLKNIHIGALIRKGVEERNIEISRICNFLKCSEEEIMEMYEAKDLSTATLLRWSKLLEYDFFRIYSQHLILYAPQGNINYNNVSNKKKSGLPQFRKNIYTKEMIDFILEMISSKEKTLTQVAEEYRIPRTTLYKWIDKYNKNRGNSEGDG